MNMGEISKFVGVLALDPQGVVLASQLLDAVNFDLLPDTAAKTFVVESVEEWWRQLAKGLPADSGVVALAAARKTAGHRAGFPGREKIDRTDLGSTRYVAQSFDTVREYHFEVEAVLSETPLELDSCTRVEFANAAMAMLEDVKRRSAAGEPVVRGKAWLGAPVGVIWTTHTAIDPLDKPGPEVAELFWERLALVDLHWRYGAGLFVYSVDSDRLGECYRPTPVEGFNRRFRVIPCKTDFYDPFGATVHLGRLKNRLVDGDEVDDDGVHESVSKPFQPDGILWKELIRDVRFAGALSVVDDQCHVTDQQFQERVLLGIDPKQRVADFLAMLDAAVV